MKIRNIDGLSAMDLQREADKGAKFVYFTVHTTRVTFWLVGHSIRTEVYT
jgi:hypothetical protein